MAAARSAVNFAPSTRAVERADEQRAAMRERVEIAARGRGQRRVGDFDAPCLGIERDDAIEPRAHARGVARIVELGRQRGMDAIDTHEGEARYTHRCGITHAKRVDRRVEHREAARTVARGIARRELRRDRRSAVRVRGRTGAEQHAGQEKDAAHHRSGAASVPARRSISSTSAWNCARSVRRTSMAPTIGGRSKAGSMRA